jgi:hypothetical protein
MIKKAFLLIKRLHFLANKTPTTHKNLVSPISPNYQQRMSASMVSVGAGTLLQLDRIDFCQILVRGLRLKPTAQV